MRRLLNHRLLWILAAMFSHPLLGAAADEPKGGGKLDPVSVITVILVASFVIDRIVIGALSVLSWAKVLKPSTGKEQSEKRQKFTYLVLAGVLGVFLAQVGNVKLLENLGFSPEPSLNIVVTTLILMAGADRIGELIKRMGGSSLVEKKPDPLVIEGRVLLVEDRKDQDEPAKTQKLAAEKAVTAGQP